MQSGLSSCDSAERPDAARNRSSEQSSVFSSGSKRDDAAPEDEDRRGQWASALICLVLFAGTAGLIWYIGPMHLLRQLLRALPARPGWEWYVGMTVITMLVIVMLLPFGGLCLANGLVFGFYGGAVVNFVAIVSSAVISLILGRFFLREPIQRSLEGDAYPQTRRIMLILEDSEESLKFQVLFRFLFIPMFVRNYAPSVLCIPFWKLCVSTLPHSAWISLLFASLGSTFKDAAELMRDGEELDRTALKWQSLLILFVSIAVSAVLAWFAHRKYRERLEQEDNEDLRKGRDGIEEAHEKSAADRIAAQT